jgi:hypothetical protein
VLLIDCFQFDLAEAWAARLIDPLEAEHQQVKTRFICIYQSAVDAIVLGRFCHDRCPSFFAKAVNKPSQKFLVEIQLFGRIEYTFTPFGWKLHLKK